MSPVFEPNMLKLLIISLTFYLRHISITNSAACSSLVYEVDCQNSPSCEWNGALTTPCYCTSQSPLDVVFILDESGSVGSTNFVTQKEWIASMIREGLSDDSKIHVLTFGSNVKTHYEFWDDQSNKTYIAAQVEKIGYPRGVTRMDLAVQHVTNVVFPTWITKPSYTNNKRLLVFLTDGRPCCVSYATPCPDVAKLHAVVPDVLVVGIGSGWTLSSVACMVTDDFPNNLIHDPTRIISVPTWSAGDFANAKILTEDFLCPEDVSFKVTEIRILQYSNGAITHHSRFVEFFNPVDGEDIDLTKTSLIFTGFMSSTRFGFGVPDTNCTNILSAGKYVVFYDPSADRPRCGGCSCTMTGAYLQCDDAIYIPCDSDPQTSGCGACSWDTSMDNDNWAQAVFDFAGNFELSSVSRNDTDSRWLFTTYTGYSTELKGVGYPESEPGSWQPSCNYTGTPGQEPLPLPCAVDCIPDICRSQGDSSATCSNDYDICDCTEADKYYYSPNGYCTKLLPPTDCTVDNVKQAGYGIFATIEWDITTQNYESGTYFLVYIDGEQNRANGASLLSSDISQTSTVYVVAAFEDEVAGIVQSLPAICPVFTVGPTREPTPDPTQGNADVPYCNGEITDYNLISLRWGDGYKKEPTDIEGPYTYYIYGNIIPGDDSTAFTQTATTENIDLNLNKIISSSFTLDIATNGWPEIYVVTEYQTDSFEGLDPATLAVMKGPTGGKALCSLSTNVPTTSPTKDPTVDPTADPTTDPTDDPTPAPSYGTPVLQDCIIDIPGQHEIKDGLPITLSYTVNVPSDAGDQPTIEFSADSISIDQIVNSQGLMIVTLAQDVIEDAIIATDSGNDDNAFKARVKYQLYPGSIRSNGEWVICDYETSAPTPAPTDGPTHDPTIDPTSDPTSDPTTDPTGVPTPAPTFQKLSLPTPCIAEINADATDFTIVFIETTFDDEDPERKYPLSDLINYEIRIGNLKSKDDVVEIQTASQSGAQVRYPIKDGQVTPNQFIVGTSTITIDIINDLGDRNNLPITCDITTQSPTSAPTTPEPTKHPVVDNPIVRFEVVSGYDADENPIFTDWGTDGNCVLPADRRRRQMETMRRLLQDEDGDEEDEEEEEAVLVNDCIFCPVCPVKENSDPKYLRVIRDPIDFPYDVLVRITMSYLVDTAGEGIDKKDFDLKEIDENEPNDLNLAQGNQLKKFFGKEKNNFLAFYIMGARDNPTGEVVIPYYLEVDDEEDSDEAFEVSIKNCEVATENMPNIPPAALSNYYSCESGAYYTTVIVQITDTEQGDSFTSTSQGDLPLWIWAPVGFAAVAIPILAYLIYRFYQGKKRADALEKQRKHELEEHAKMDDIGEFGTIGDNVRANPLATGDAFEIPKGDEAIAHQLTMDKMQFEPATVDVEHNIFKQDFGPVQAEKHMSMDQLIDDGHQGGNANANSRENSVAL